MSIEAKDLRIGNLIYNNVLSEIIEINSFSGTCYVRTVLDAKTSAELYLDCDIEPIPLTEELILKLGFEVCHKTFVRHSFDYADSTEHGIEINLMERGGWEKPQYRYYGRYIDVLYVHQVQNLFYALSGRELKFQMKK